MIYSFRLGGTFTMFSAPAEEVEALTGVAVDVAGNAYVTGYTAYTDFPTTPGAAFPNPPGLGICGSSLCRDAFVSKLKATVLRWFTPRFWEATPSTTAPVSPWIPQVTPMSVE